jgi:hypothetical protein
MELGQLRHFLPLVEELSINRTRPVRLTATDQRRAGGTGRTPHP